MAQRYSGQDISIYTVDGIALAPLGTNFTFSLTDDVQDAGLISRLGKNSQPVKTSGELAIDLNSVITGSQRTSHINVTAFTIGGTSYLDELSSFSLSGSYDQVMQSGIGEKWTRPQVVAKDYQITVVLTLSTGDALILAAMMDGANFADSDQTVSITVNSVVITIPMNIFSYSLAAARYDLQKLTLQFNGADPGAGDYPTAPTSTSTIFQKALNAPTAEMAFSFQNALAANTGGINVSGTCVFKSFSFEVSDGNLVAENYTFATYGTVTVVASS